MEGRGGGSSEPPETPLYPLLVFPCVLCSFAIVYEELVVLLIAILLICMQIGLFVFYCIYGWSVIMALNGHI